MSASRARKHWVRNSKTLRPCGRHVVTTFRMRSTKRLPDALAVPPLIVRPNTARRHARSAALFLGSIPRTPRKVYRCSSSASNLRHVVAVFSLAHAAPRENACRTPRRMGWA